MRQILSRLTATFRRRRLDHESDEELRTHLALLEERLIAQGMEPGEAYYAARRQFGGVTQVQQGLRDKRTFLTIDVLLQDIRHACRQLRKAKGFTAAAALTLALGIGASTAVFTVLDTVVLRPLPFPDADRLMAFRTVDRQGVPQTLSYPDFFDFRNHRGAFQHLVCYRESGFTLTDSQPAMHVPGAIVSWDLFPMLGVQPALGRGFLAEEEKPGSRAVVLSHGLWKRRFGGDEAILGQTIHMNGSGYTVVGVAPAGFQFPIETASVQVWVTLANEGGPLNQRGGRMLDAVGKLAPGISEQQAQMQFDTLAKTIRQQHPESTTLNGALVIPEVERLAGTSLKGLLTLQAAVAILLAIACANVANLLLARKAERMREFALRTALGASRLAIARQIVIESFVLALLGAAGGIAIAFAALRATLPLLGESIPRLSQAAIDGRILAFAIAIAFVTSLLFSLAPAVQASRTDPAGTMKQSARGISRGHDRFRSGLVVVQIALGLILLSGAELLMTGFLHAARRDPGFRYDRLLLFDIGLAERDKERVLAFSDRLLEELRSIPGVESAGAGGPLPLQGHSMRIAFDIEHQPTERANRPRSDVAIVSVGYFATMGIPLLNGRDFNSGDREDSPPVVIVNQAFAKKFFPGQDAVGKRIKPGAGMNPPMRQIVGIVGDAKQAPLGDESEPIYYLAYKQLPWNPGTIVLRTSGSPRDVEASARAVVSKLNAQSAIHTVRTGEELASVAIARIAFFTMVMGAFAGIALALTGAGLYGVLAYTVARRRNEMGVRMALGAGRRDVLGLVFRQAMGMVGLGIVVGAASAVAGGRLLGSMIYGTSNADLFLTLAIACLIVAVTGFAAAYAPAVRAASADPMQALRTE